MGFAAAAGLVHELMEARDERRLLNLQRQLSRPNLLIMDELGLVPLSRTGAELLFEVFSQRYERGFILVATNLPFYEWTEVLGSDRLTHDIQILEMNGDRYKLKGSRENNPPQVPDDPEEEYGASPTTLSLPSHLALQLCLIYCRQSAGQWYTILQPQWPNISAPLILLG